MTDIKEMVIKIELDHICADGAALVVTRLNGPSSTVIDQLHLREGEAICFTANTNFEDEVMTNEV